MALTKAEVIEVVYKDLGLPKNHCTELVETLLEIIKKTLEDGEDVLIDVAVLYFCHFIR